MRRVYVDFDDHDMADRFFDALAEWLTEDVPWDASGSPIIYKPRHFFWADADVSAENVASTSTSSEALRQTGDSPEPGAGDEGVLYPPADLLEEARIDLLAWLEAYPGAPAENTHNLVCRIEAAQARDSASEDRADLIWAVGELNMRSAGVPTVQANIDRIHRRLTSADSQEGAE